MAEYWVKCWDDCRFTPVPTQQGQMEFLLEGIGHGATDILIRSRTETGNQLEFAVLCDAIQLGGICYPAGSRIILGDRYAAQTHSSQQIVTGRIETDTGDQSDMLIFSNGSLDPLQVFTPLPGFAQIAQPDQTFFARGTLIDTPHGAIPVEHLEDGDEVMMPGGGIQLIQRLNQHRYSGLDLALAPTLVPVRITAGALTGGRPGQDLLVAQGHGLLVDDWRAAYFFGVDEVLVPAQSLLNGTSVILEDHRAGVEYFGIAVENAGLVCANGLWAESQTHADVEDRATPAAQGAPMADTARPQGQAIPLVA